MAVDTDFALAGADGIASVAPTGTTAPIDLSALPVAWLDLGAMSTDGLTQAMGESRTAFKRWGSITPFKTVMTDQTFTFEAKFLETNNHVLGLFYKVADPTPDPTSKIVTVTPDTSGNQDHRSFVFDVIESGNHLRFYLPRGEVTNRANPVYKQDGLVEYGMTITAYVDPTAGYAVRVFAGLVANLYVGG